MLPFMFVLNKQNYARYGPIYVNTSEYLDITHPRCRELLERNGLSVQGQDIYPCRTPTDQRGAQTINRDAKVAGGIKYFASDQNAILKWTLNRAAQAKNTEKLYNIAGVRSSEDMYKMIRPSEVLKSERLVTKLENVITKEYLNPFDASLDPSCLYNLSSGVPVDHDLCRSIINLKRLEKICTKILLMIELNLHR